MLKKETTNLDINQGSGLLRKLEIRGANDEHSDSFSSDESSQDNINNDSDHLENQTTQGSPRARAPETNIDKDYHKYRFRRSSLLAQSHDSEYVFSKVKLYVIKMMPQVRSSTSQNIMDSNRKKKHQHQCEYFKMKIDPERCDPESNNDQDLRIFKRRVRERFSFPENFRLYNQQGHAIQDFELSIINQDERGCGVVYVSPPNVSFDFDTYIKMFRELKKLGEGGFGYVILSQHIITKEKYAIKSIQPYVHKADEVSKVFKEALVLQKLNHPNVIRLFNVFQLPDTRIIFFMEYLKGGSLADHLKNFEGERVKESAAQKIMYEAICAINFCHQKQIVHRDIKLENIMLREKGDVSSGLVIIDFGIAGQLQQQKEKQNEGTIRYAPPELVSSKKLTADTQFDVWSLGILLYRLVSGIFPFDGKTFGEIRNKIIKEEPDFSESIFSELSDTCIALIKLMLTKDSKQRPRLNQLILHPWFQTSKHQQTLMNMTMFQNNQNTMMNFFKQELQNVEAQRRKNESPTTAASKNNQLIIVDENEQQSPSLLNYNQQRTIQQRGSLQYQNNQSPGGKIVQNRIQIDQIDKFTIVPNRVKGTAEFNKGRGIESALSLSTKKQKLNDIRSLKPPQFDSVSMDRDINSNEVQESLDKLSLKMMMVKKRQQQVQSHQRNENSKSIQEQNRLKQNSSHQRSSVLTQHSNQSQIPPQSYLKQKDSYKPSKFGNGHHRNMKSIEVLQESELPRIGQQEQKKQNGAATRVVPPQLNQILARIINQVDETPMLNENSISPINKNRMMQFDSFANKNKSTISNRASPQFNYHQQSQDSSNVKIPLQGSISRIANGGVIMDSIGLNVSQNKKKPQAMLYKQAQDIQINELSINKQSNFKQTPNEFKIQRMNNNSNLQQQSHEMIMPKGEYKQQPQSFAKIQLKNIS